MRRLIFVGALLLTSTLGGVTWAGMPTTDRFSQACHRRLADVQAELRVCVVAVVVAPDKVEVLHATIPGLSGRTLRALGSSGVQSAQTPLRQLIGLQGRIVVVGGQLNGQSIYGARLL